MHADELRLRLDELIAAAGLDPAAPEPRAAWSVFVAAAREPVEGLDPELELDLLQFEAGPSPARPVELSMVRTISLYERDDYVGSRVLSWALLFEATPELQALERALVQGPGSSVRRVGRDTVSEFAARVEATPAFGVLVAQRPMAAELVFGPG